MALGSTQPLVNMTTRNIPGGKGGQCMRLTTSPPSRAECHELLEPKPPGTSGPHQACYGTPLPLPYTYMVKTNKHPFIFTFLLTESYTFTNLQTANVLIHSILIHSVISVKFKIPDQWLTSYDEIHNTDHL
jgi:hypothetical protein